MNISGDLSVSEFKTERYVEAVPIKKGGGFVGKSSFLDLIKNLQGSVQKGLDETLTEIQNTLSKTEDSAVRPEENVENIDEKKTESIESTRSQEEVEPEIRKIPKEDEEIQTIKEETNVSTLPWFLVAEAKSNETLNTETDIPDAFQEEIVEKVSSETLESGQPVSTSKLVENLFSKEESLSESKKETSVSLEEPKETQSRTTSKKESSVREGESKLSESKVASEVSKFNEINVKEFQENHGKGISNKETFSKGADETKTEVSKELVLDSEKWKIDRDKKTDSYANLKSSGKEEIKVSSQFSENSSGKSGQERSFRSGGGDSYSSLVKGVGTPTVSGKGPNSQDFSVPKETNVLSKRDIRQNFQNLIRSARVSILENGKTEANIRMNPKDLGQMSLVVSTDKDVVRGKLLVESDTIKQQLVAELANLKQDLKANGLELESLAIEVREREEVFAFDTDSDKNGKDSRSFQSAFGEEWSSDFKDSFYEEDELSFEEKSHDFSEKTERKTQKLLDLKV
ncbi:flagellar hook-length control protein FliK [Leptospira santarosai]|uniref:flagellar hook-length control protein FliK n=1 Tax=Leptospira santarosai TaxID=28183 RepID=UPI0024AFE803|nr:flagellar hook-length control protein FliK [Leptospira santarosai]MDI7185585.1 flagellar hook-length control protein FliK [Leptospira santarosai]MDI7190058.1 flagellar hook-length control protein FliK [Leptospira santarosai]MDI7198538.1 flagellar hook-length control protein FliK [Leptospira santarosai]MDI7214405.1 flagellar hook-length control protein FliK [Leptospira santarosai]MDI7221631.1 flagellar hook-length control protein FliK [Leptospira santarosai]